METQPHILFVDDEDAIRTTVSLILETHGFKVTSVATVPEALSLISRSSFDVLIADLNIGSPGDGFTVVSAMRRTQPNAATFILTGYPDINSALQAIRQQVDDYLIKPTEAESLVEKIREKLQRRGPARREIAPQRLTDILARSKDDMIEKWLRAANADPEISSIPLSDDLRKDHVPMVLDAAIRIVRGGKITPDEKSAAAAHGTTRWYQGYSVPLIVREARMLHDVMATCIQKNLLQIQISNLIPDMVHAFDAVDVLLEESCRAFVAADNSGPKTSAKKKRAS